MTCLAIGTLGDALTRHLAPNDVGRTPFGAPPRHFSDPDRPLRALACARAVQRVVSHVRPVVVGAFGRGARVRGDKSRPQEPLLSSACRPIFRKTPSAEPGCPDCALRQESCEGVYAPKIQSGFPLLSRRGLLDGQQTLTFVAHAIGKHDLPPGERLPLLRWLLARIPAERRDFHKT